MDILEPSTLPSSINCLTASNKIEGSLFGAFEDYGYLSPAFLSGKEELACFDKRSYNLVKCSTDAKAIGIMALFKKLMKNEITPEILY